METKRIILEIEEGLHKRIKDFAAKDKRTLTVVLRIMTEEMLEKLINEKETLLNNVVSNVTTVVTDMSKTFVTDMSKTLDWKCEQVAILDFYSSYGRSPTKLELSKHMECVDYTHYNNVDTSNIISMYGDENIEEDVRRSEISTQGRLLTPQERFRIADSLNDKF